MTFADFHLQEVHVTGGGSACDGAGGNGATGCLIGYFNADVVPSIMTVGPPTPFTTELTPAGVQLIR